MTPTPDKEKLWVAYLDGQLTASEALAFEATLSPAERALCGLELRLERTLGERLREAPACPEATWRKALDLVPPRSGSRGVSWLGRPVVAIPTLLGFAAAMLMTFQNLPRTVKYEDPLLTVAGTVEELAESAATEPDSISVQNFLEQRAVRLTMAGFPETMDFGHHHIQLLGACERGCRGKTVVEVLFECCGEPAKVLIAERGTRAEGILRGARGTGDIRHIRELNGYVAAVLSKHGAADLTALFSSPEQHVADMRI